MAKLDADIIPGSYLSFALKAHQRGEITDREWDEMKNNFRHRQKRIYKNN